jgi:hypothetical protein
VNNIIAWLRIRGGARFNRVLRSAADEVRDLARAARDANQQYGGLGGALGALGNVIPNVTGRTRLFGFAIGTVITALILAIPLVVGLGGALVAVTGSLAAAAIGAGLFAGALVGVLGAALGSVGLMLFDAMKNFTDVNERFTTWRNAVKSFGPDSEQAVTALKRLNGVVATSGGPLILEAVQTWQQLRDEFATAMAPVLEKVMVGFLDVFRAIRVLLPTVVKFNDIVVTALGGVLQAWLGYLTSKQLQNSLILIAQSFSKISGPIGIGLLNIFRGLMSLVIRMLPFLNPVAVGFEHITGAFSDWAATGNLNPFISQFMAWVNLLKAAGALLVTILSAGATSGQSLVATLTAVINKWNAALNTGAGQSGMKSFFADSVKMAGAFFKVFAGIIGGIFKFGRMLVPVYSVIFKAFSDGWKMLMDALAPAKPFFDNILGPLLKGIADALIDSLVGAFKLVIFVIKILAIVLGFLGKKLAFLKPVFYVLGYIIGLVFGPWILKLLGTLGKLSMLLRPLAFLFRLWYLQIRVAGWLLGKLLGPLMKVMGWFIAFTIRVFPAWRAIWMKILSFIASLVIRFGSAGARLWNSLKTGFLRAMAGAWDVAKDVAKILINPMINLLNKLIPNKIPIPYGPDIDLPDNPIPMLASGGVVSGMGSWITGEAGPELNTLRNGRVTVQPLAAISTPAPSSATVDPGGGKRVIVTKVFLRGREIAEAVADEAEDDVARRWRG